VVKSAVDATVENLVVSGSLATSVARAVSVFGVEVKSRLVGGEGEPEDQMRGPLEILLATVAAELGVSITTVGEATLSDLRVRPDYAVKVNGVVSGYVEVKRPGRGADPTLWKRGSHDAEQWEKLKALPNVLYTDGQSWGLYRTGEPAVEVVHLIGDIRRAGAALTTADDQLARLLSTFVHWKPVAPRQIGQLVRSVAPLTRLLRDEVIDTLACEHKEGGGPFTELAEDWRGLLFPEADDFQFADGYAQSVAFALLLARTERIDFSGKSVVAIALELGKTHSLLGKALAILTDESIGALVVTLDTLVRVISVVDFGRFATHVADPYLALYEHFLAEYDPELRKLTGSYYTPGAVVSSMTRLTDQALRTRLGLEQGLASKNITIVDPAMGTGTYVLDVLEVVAVTVADAEGPGAVPSRLRDTATRLVGIEIQTGPYAVAELRVAEALHRYDAGIPADGLRLYVADSLDDPFAEQAHLAATLAPIAASRKGANVMKAHEPVVVVLGNPPYRENAAGHGGFIEHGAPNTEWNRPLLDSFKEPGAGRFYKDLANLYVYFWRWATWKVFEAHPEKNDGVVCFITTSGYLKGPGFAGMRRYLRKHASEGWIIDCTPEGHQPDVSTRIFGGVQQPVCIGLFVRSADKQLTVPAIIHYRAVSGKQVQKFESLQVIQLDGDGWEDCPTDWTAPFLPVGNALWDASPSLGDLYPWHVPGLTPNRTWVYAPQATILADRWKTLVTAPISEKVALFRESRDAKLNKKKDGLVGFAHADLAVGEETGPCLSPVHVAYRAFDVQYVIPDDRLMHCPRPDLWRVRSDDQLYISEQHDQVLRSGPGLMFSAFIPDIHYYAGRGGRVLPLYAATETTPNLVPGLLDALSDRLDRAVSAEDFVAYVAAITAHPAFVERFSEDLRTPGIRVPITSDSLLFDTAVKLGRQVLWLHTRGQRFADAKAGRSKGAPDVTDTAHRPMVVVPIPDSAVQYPDDDIAYNLATETLSIGEGRIAPVSQAVIDYEISGMNVLRKWYGYRRRTRPQARGEQSALDDIRPTTWPSEYTTDLLELLRVLTLVTELEPAQAELLSRVVQSPLITVGDLVEAGVLPVPDAAREPLPKLSRAKTKGRKPDALFGFLSSEDTE
jgi:hypothetical protein